jgi:hypothetical protein
MAALVGALVPSFARAADLLATLTPVQVSARALETFTEAVGQAYTLPEPPAIPPTPEVLVVQCDGGMVHMRPGQWQEMKALLVYRHDGGEDQPPQRAVVQGPWAEQDALLLTLATREGLAHAAQVVCLADGARAIWPVLERCFPQACHLLDWYHLMEHVSAVATLLPEGTAWRDIQATALWERGPQTTLRALLALQREATLPEATRAAARSCFTYLWHNRHRVDYAEARRRGFPCGSGRVESTIKATLQARAKGPGMRWEPHHVQAVLNVRCAIENGDFMLACAQAKAAARSPWKAAASTPLRGPGLPVQHPHPPARPTRRVATPRPADLTIKQATRIIKGAFQLG